MHSRVESLPFQCDNYTAVDRGVSVSYRLLYVGILLVFFSIMWYFIFSLSSTLTLNVSWQIEWIFFLSLRFKATNIGSEKEQRKRETDPSIFPSPTFVS